MDEARTPDVALLAQAETPCYLFDPALVIDELAALKEQLGTPVIVSVKACPVLDLLVRCVHALGDGIEIASLGELNLTVGRMSVPRWVNTPAMDAGVVAAALACRATLIAENPHQVRLIEQAATKSAPREGGEAAPVDVLLRVHAASLLARSNGPRDHFGMDIPTLHAQLARLQAAPSRLRVTGLHVFAGSHSFDSSAGALAQRLHALVRELQQRWDLSLDCVIIGAGLPAAWRRCLPALHDYREQLAPLKAEVRVLHEAGRAVFARAGSFATRVVAVKELGGETVVVCDGGMAQCFALAQTENFVKQPREPRVVHDSSAAHDDWAEPRTLTVVGNSCNRADVIGRLHTRRCPQHGDLLVFEHSGAYHSYSPTGFLNLRPAQHYVAS